ncbi:hypothetical protein D3C86_1861810 [compost metagenome]
MYDLVNNGGNLLEAAADFCSFTRHRLQGNMHFCLVRTAKHLVQTVSNPLNAEFRILVSVGSRMKYNMLHLKRMRTADFLLQEINSQLIRTFLVRAQVDDVRSMDYNFFHTIVFHRLLAFCGIH